MSAAPVPSSRAGPSAEAAGARLGELFSRHGRMVFGLSRMLLGDASEAEDATQQTFLSAYRALLGGTDPRDAARWLATIARNECRRRLGERATRPLPVDVIERPGVESVAEAAERRSELETLVRELLELPERQRDAVVLRDLYGLDYGEVGAVLGVSRPTVESLLYRGRRRLQGRVRPAGAGGVAVPAAVFAALVDAVPGFAAGSAGVGVSAGAGAGLLVKLAAAPLAGKAAVATVAVSIAGGGATAVRLGGGSGPPATPPVVAAAASVPAVTAEATAEPAPPWPPLRAAGSSAGGRGGDETRDGTARRGPGDRATVAVSDEEGEHGGRGSGGEERDREREPVAIVERDHERSHGGAEEEDEWEEEEEEDEQEEAEEDDADEPDEEDDEDGSSETDEPDD